MPRVVAAERREAGQEEKRENEPDDSDHHEDKAGQIEIDSGHAEVESEGQDCADRYKNQAKSSGHW